MNIQLRDFARRKRDLLTTADRLDLACRNQMTLLSLKEHIALIAANLREKAQTLQEAIEDQITEASLAEKTTKKGDKGHGTAIQTGDTGRGVRGSLTDRNLPTD